MIAAVPAVRRARPNLAVLAGAAALVFGILIAGAIVAERRDAPATDSSVSRRDLQAVLAYADAIAPATHLAGQAIILGIRQDIGDFRAGRISAEVWKADMEARAAEFSRAWSAFRATPAPNVLGDASKAFDRAFAAYLQAAETLRLAGDVTGAERERLITVGARTGDEGDDAFDHGAAAIQRVRRAAGMEPDLRFPDKEQS